MVDSNGWFEVGDKVRVVRGFDNSLGEYLGLHLPEGAEFTVTEVKSSEGAHGDSDYGINVDNGDGGFGSWAADRFELVSSIDSPEKGSPERDVPADVERAHKQAAVLFGLLAASAAEAFIEGRPDQVKFIKQVCQHLDDVMTSLEEAYPSLNKEVD